MDSAKLGDRMIFEKTIIGAVGGALYALTGYWKNNSRNGEKFDYLQFGIAGLFGALFGTGLDIANINQGAISSMMETFASTAILQNILKGLNIYKEKSNIAGGTQ